MEEILVYPPLNVAQSAWPLAMLSAYLRQRYMFHYKILLLPSEYVASFIMGKPVGKMLGVKLFLEFTEALMLYVLVSIFLDLF